MLKVIYTQNWRDTVVLLRVQYPHHSVIAFYRRYFFSKKDHLD